MTGYIYVLTNKHKKVLYTGVTGDLKQRLEEHANGSSWFTTKYKTDKLVYIEFFENIEDAIARANERWEDLSGNLPK